MGEAKSSNERKNLVIKTLIIVVLLLLAFLSTVIYIFAYPKTTVTLYDDETTEYNILSQFKVKKYSKLGELSAHEKSGYTFLYWAYEDDTEFDPNRELDVDALSLYATYSKNSYTITYHVQVYNENAEQEGYTSNQPGYRSRTELFGETIRLPYGTVGDEKNAELLPELRNRVGYHFAGWTTKVTEEEIMSESDVRAPGDPFVVPAGDVDLYAYWEKNEYEVITHTGNEYQMEADGVTPKKDEEGNFIIRNNRVQEIKSLKYLESITGITSGVKAALDEQDGLVIDDVNIEDYKEYDFKGWYLDENYTISADADYTAKVNVVGGVEIPYLEYVDDYGNVSIVNSVFDNGKYQFHLYSKWERRSYTISFSNNHSGSNGKLAPVTIYKYDDHYGKFYYHTIDLREITTSEYLNSNKGYQFYAWSTTAQATDPDCVTYYQWLQDPISYDANGRIIESEPYYDFFTYRHEVSEDKTFYTLWSRIRSVTFYQKNGSNRFNGASFVVEGIAKQWFKLPDSSYIVGELGWSINDYQYFAGWRVGSGTTGEPILEKNPDGTYNKEYYWIFSSTSTTSVTICAYWESYKYKVEYYLNDGTDNKLDDVYADGGKKTYYAAAPARENYIFDGWSTEIYPDNTLKSAKNTYTSANSFVPRGSETTLKFYASWTMNFTVSYDLGVADDSITGTLPTGIEYAKKGNELKMTLSVGSGSTLKRNGFVFKGWVLKNQDGSYNTDILFKAGNSVIFNFAGIDVSQGNIEGSCYISGLASKQYPFYMDTTDTNHVKLYAYWEAKTYTITIHDTATGATNVYDAKYGQDFNFADYVTMNYVGKKFIGLSASENGPIQYSTNLGMVLYGTDIVGNLVFFARYEIREINVKYMIKADDAGVLEDVEFKPAFGYSGYGNKPVLYNDELVLPTPSTYNANFRFTYWYYIETDENGDEIQIPVYSGDRLVYEGDNLTLWANYVEETYTLEFKFINPLNTAEVTTINKDIDGNLLTITKGSEISSELYSYIIALLTNYENEKQIQEYTLEGLFNTYQGQPYQFVSGKLVNVGNYPAIQSSNVLTFVTVWTANAVNFVYNSGEEAGSEKNTSYHTGKDYESTDSIMLEDVKFDDLNDGESVYRWYIKVQTGDNQGEKLYLDKGSYLIGFKGQFESISAMREYISWSKVNGRYVGTINIYAETQQVFTIEYHRINQGTLELLKTDTHIYDGFDNVLDLVGSIEALKDLGTGMIFNGWVIYSSVGRVTTVGEKGLVGSGTLTLDPTIFTDYRVFCYADISYIVDYNYLALSNGSFSTVDLKTEEITLIKNRDLDYTNSSNYYTNHIISSMVSLDADTLASYQDNGYEYYGYEIGGEIYSKNDILNSFSIEITGSKINILCYVTTTRTVTYSIDTTKGDTFTSSNLAGKSSTAYTYVIGYDNRVVAERVFVNATDYVENKTTAVTIKDINVRREGYLFSGWQQSKDGSIYADIYKNGDVIYLTENITFVAYFTTPEANSIKGYINYLDVDGTLLKKVEVWNGTEHTLIDAEGLGNYDNNIYKAVYSWNYEGVEYRIGEKFSVPLLISAGEVFEFTAIVKDKYTIVFETYTDNKPDSIVTFADEENALPGIPTLADGIEFSHWRFELVDDRDGSSEMIKINYNDSIAFRKSDGITPVKYSCTAMLGGYNLHIIPVREGIHIYTLEAVAVSEVTITLTGTAATGTHTDTLVVEYGATFVDARELLTDEMKALETVDRGICAWTTDSSKTDIDLYSEEQKLELQNNITRITKNNLQLYAVWQTKYTVTYAAEDTTFGYKDYTPTSNYYFEGDTVEFDVNVVKSIYYKGFNTVYYDNGTYIVHSASGNDYYYVIGFVAQFEVDGMISGATQEYRLADGSFEMPGANVILTPITKTITYRVDFMENAATTEDEDKTLKTIYTPDVPGLDLNEHTAVRSNFKFLGWNTEADAENPLSQDEVEKLTNQNTTLYAVWASNILISFSYNNAVLFTIPLNKLGKLSASKLEYYLSIEDETIENGYLIFESLNGSDRTYFYNEKYFYLQQFTYQNKAYETIEEICAANFTISSTVNLIFDEIYTISYMSTDPTSDEETSEVISINYFTQNGEITSTGIEELTLSINPTEYTNKYYQTSGWLDINSNFYNFEEVLNEDKIAVLIQLSEDYIVSMYLNWSAKSFEIILNYTDKPYTNFSAYSTANEVLTNTAWTNIASANITDKEGSIVSTTSTVSLTYGSSFVIQFDADILENYMIIGWSKTLYPLGFYGSQDTDDIIYRYMTEDGLMYSYSLTYLFDSVIIEDDTTVVLYPVFIPVPTHTVHIVASNGKFTYEFANDDTYKTGYMADFTVTSGTSDYSSQEINLYFYNIVTVTADQPANDYYKFDTMTSTIGSISDSVLTIKGTDIGSCTNFNDCHEEVKITYVVKTVTINAKLDYTRELKSLSDTTTIALSAGGSSVTLSYANKVSSLVVPANSELSAIATIGEHFKLFTIMSGENALAITNNKIDIMLLSLNENDEAELIFTVAPISYKITLELQGGRIGDIEYDSELFGDGVILYENIPFEVVYDAIITMPAPTLTKYVFNYWKVNGVTMNAISDYEVKSNLNIIAYFIQNTYSAEYTLEGATQIIDVNFVGGEELIVGRDNGKSDGDLISANTLPGYTHISWKEKNSTYYDDDPIKPTERRDYSFIQVVKGENITINYMYNTTTLASIDVEYGQEFAIPTLRELATNNVDGMMLYGFATTLEENAENRKIFTLGQENIDLREDLGYEIIDSSTSRTITLYAVYYVKYTYTFIYGTEEFPTTIATETYEISAKDIYKEVNIGDLKYTLNATIPTAPSQEEIFAGYNIVYIINGVTTTVMGVDGTTEALINAGETITLEDPKNHNFEQQITYVLTPKYSPIDGAQEIKLYITNPENPNDSSANLKVNYESIVNGKNQVFTNEEYYPIKVLLNNSFFATSTPAYEYSKALQSANTVTWTILSNNKTFTTSNAKLYAYKLLGYTLTYTLNGSTITKNIELDNPTEAHSIAGGSDYVLKPIWEQRFAVRYYDADNIEITSVTDYYDQGTQLKVERIIDENDNYDKLDEVFVGFARTANATIKYTSDFYAFDQEFTITSDEGDYNFYPAYSQVYTVNFATNAELLNRNGGDSDNINVTNNVAVTTYVGAPLITLENYFTVEYTADGYKFGGFTVKSGKLANDLTENEIISEYTLNSDDLSEDELYIYVAWDRASYKVSFVMTATYNDKTYADSIAYVTDYLYNEIINFEDAALEAKFTALEDAALEAKITALEEKCFVFKNFSFSEGGKEITENVQVQGILTIYVNFDYVFTVIYNLGEAKYVSEETERLSTDRGIVGTTIEAYDANSNLVYDGLTDLYWTVVAPQQAPRPNFFDANNKHMFTTADLSYANNNYEINLYLTGGVAKYTVNLHYFSNFADLDLSYEKLQAMDTPDYTKLNYSVMTVEDVDYGTELLDFGQGSIEIDENYMPVESPTSPFNAQIKTVFGGETYVYGNKTYEINDLYDLLYMFQSQGYVSNGYVNVNNTTTTTLSSIISTTYYYAQTYAGADTYVNNVYLIYGLVSFQFETKTYLVDEGAVIANNASLTYTGIDTINTEIATGDRTQTIGGKNSLTCQVTIKDLVVFTPTEESLESNIGYNFIGVYSAEYDSEGKIVKFIPLSYEDWEADAIPNSYYIKQDNSVYLFYSEKQVKVKIQYSSPDNKFDSLSLNILLDGDSAEDRISKNADGKGLEVNALYGQIIDISNASLMPYNISYMVIDGALRHDFSELSYELVSTTEGEELEEIVIVVYFEIQLVEVYFYTHTENPFTNGGLFYGEITSVTYVDGLGVQWNVNEENIKSTYKYCKYDKYYYNYAVLLPFGSTIIKVDTTLNNYHVAKWILNNDIEYTTLNVIASNDCHLRAEFEANDISVEFYTSNLNGEEYARKISELTITGIKYGDKITLPNAVVEEELYISRGWLIDNDRFDWGVETSAVITGNEQLKDNILKVYANSINKYYIVFANDSDVELTIPEKYKTRNELVVADYSISLPKNTTIYTYVNANNIANITLESRTIAGDEYVITSYVELPEELLYTNVLEFGGWATKQSTIVIDYYTFNEGHITNVNTHEIKLSMLNSGMVVLKFYITNPEDTANAGKDFNLGNTANIDGTFNIPYIQMIYNTESKISSIITPVGSETTSFIQWGSYFMNDTDVDLLSNYEFHGWSIVRQGVLNSPSTEYANISDVSALMYTFDSGTARAKRTNNQILDSIQELLKDEYYEFYTVWEAKHTIVFDAEYDYDDENHKEYTNGFKLTNKYAQGEVIPLPNNLDKSSAAYYDIENGSNKLMGWEDRDKGIERLFSDCTSGIYTLVVPAQDLNLIPIWEDGVIVLFNLNFDQWRKYFAETMAANNDVNVSDVLSLIGYPYVVDGEVVDGEEVDADDYTTYSSELVNGKSYTTSFREGMYWTAGETIPVYKYDAGVFSQEGIYSVYGKDGVCYFNLIGWYLDNDQDEKYTAGTDTLITTTADDGSIILTLDKALVENGTLTIYALWEPRKVEVKFYYTHAAAIKASENPDSQNDNRYTGVVYVPFGGKITSMSTCASDTIIYMYDGDNAFMANAKGIINNGVTEAESVYYRFSFWSKTYASENILNNRKTADTPYESVISSPIMEDLYLYPVFESQYVVEFKTTSGGFLSSDLTQYVIDGEEINVGTAIDKVLSRELIDEAYYLDKNGNKVDLISSDKIVDSIKFDLANYQIDNMHFVTIYVHVMLNVKAYLPDYTTATPSITLLNSSGIGINTVYEPMKLFNITSGVLMDYGNPDFAGWYYSSEDNEKYYQNTDGKAYQLDDRDEITKFSVTVDTSSDTIKYYLKLNNSPDLIELKEVNGGLLVCLYAHFVTTTTVQIPSEATGYATLTIKTEDEDEDESNYYSIASSSNQVKLVYYTAYNSPHAPKVKVNLKYGYTITDVTNLSSVFKDTLNNSDNVSKEYIESNDLFKAYINKVTYNYQDQDGGTNNLKVDFDFKISNFQKCNYLEFKIKIEYITFNVNYVYNSNEGVLQYYKDNQYQAFATDANGNLVKKGEIQLKDNSNVLYDGANNLTTNSFTLSYNATTENGITTISLSGVPYNATLQFRVSPAYDTDIYGSMKYHFASWETGEGYIGKFTNNTQTYTPVKFVDSNKVLVRDYTITAKMEQNELTKITYQLVVPVSLGEPWYSLVQKLQQQDTVVERYDSSLDGYVITWNIDDSDFSNGIPNTVNDVKAGDDITSILEKVGEKYQAQFNTGIAEGTTMNLSILLNYLWFNNSWQAFPDDINNKVCCFEKDPVNNKNYLYFDASGEVTIYTKLSEAVLVTATHETIDYINLNLTLPVDRANITLNNEYDISKSACIISNDGESIIIKVPYGAELDLEVKPDIASSVHSGYLLYSWVVDTGNNENPLTNNTSWNFDTSNYNSYFVNYEKTSYPEYNLIAKVIIDTYSVSFINDNDKTIEKVQIGYDEELASMGYVQYGLTLSSWYGLMPFRVPDVQPTKDEIPGLITMPLFDLDRNARNASITFRHSGDVVNGALGEYKYLFKRWSLDETAVIVNYSDNIYKDVSLYANYEETTAVVYTLLYVEDNNLKNNNSEIFYLPVVDEFTDVFGNIYSNSLRISSALDWLKENSNYAFDNGDLYVGFASVEASDSEKFVTATKVGTLSEAMTEDHSTITVSNVECIQIYPAISYTVQINNDGENKNNSKIVVNTLGGVYSVNMIDSSNGYLQFNNIIKSPGESHTYISPNGTGEKQFAYWEVWSDIPSDKIDNPTLEYNIGTSSAYLLNLNKVINSHYNVRLNVAETDVGNYGKVTVYKGETDSLVGYANLQLFESSPTKRYISDSGSGKDTDEITNAKIYISFDGFIFKVIDESVSPATVIYSGEFTLTDTSISLEKIMWSITFSDSPEHNVVLMGTNGGRVDLNDAYGSVTISPFVANDAEIVLQGLYITNGSQETNNHYNSYLSFKSVYTAVDAASPMISNGVEENSQNPWGARIFFMALGSLAETSNSYVYIEENLPADVKQLLASSTTNYRWQYRIGGTNTWIDFKDGDLVNGGSNHKLYIRLACEWKEFNVTFAVMDQFNGSKFNSDKVNGFSITNGLNSNDGKISSTQGNTSAKNISYTLLYGDSIEYDYETETFTIHSTYKDNDSTITITIGDSSLYSQGWFNFTNKDENGNIKIGVLDADKVFNCSELGSYNYLDNADKHTYTIAAWLERKVDTSIVVDKGDYSKVVNGHGTIDVTVINIKNSVSQTDIHHGIKSIDTPYYSVSCGVSTKITLKAKIIDSVTLHQFKMFSYDDINQGKITCANESETEYSDNATIVAGTLDSNCYCKSYSGAHIHVLYDASDTESQFIAIDSSNTLRDSVTTTLYGGYSISKSDTTSQTTVIIKDFWGEEVKTITVKYNEKGSDGEDTLYPRENYRINNTVASKVSAGGISNNNTIVSITGSSSDAGTEFELTTYENVGYNYVLKLVEYVYTLVLKLKVDVVDSNNKSTGVVNGFGAKYIDLNALCCSIDHVLTMSIDDDKTILTISGFSDGDNIGMYYDINEGYRGMMLGVYSKSNTRIDRMFVKNNGAYNLLGMDICSISSGESLASSNYFNKDNGLDNMEGIPSTLSEFTESSYDLVVRVQERTESKISFQMTLPYASDMDNIGLRTDMVDGGTRTDYYYISGATHDPSTQYDVVGAIEFNAGMYSASNEEIINLDKNLTIGRGFTVKTVEDEDNTKITFYNQDGEYGYIEFTAVSMYDIVGWYVRKNDGFDVLTPGTDTVGGRTFAIWSAPTDSSTKITSSGVSIDCDSTIYLVLKRAEIQITYDDGTWWESKEFEYEEGYGNPNFDIEKALRYDYLKKHQFTGTSVTYPGGLVAVLPSDINDTTEVFDYGSATSGGGIEPRMSKRIIDESSPNNAIIRSGIYISYEDSDIISRVQALLQPNASKGTLITANKFFDKYGNERNSIAIVGGMSTETTPTTFDVLLKDSNDWFFIGVPTGDASSDYVSVTLYDSPETYKDKDNNEIKLSPTNIGTFNFEKDAMTFLQTLAIINDPTIIFSEIELCIAKSINSRLYDGLYCEGTPLSYPASTYSHISFTYSNPYGSYKDTAGSQIPMLTGYRIVDNNGNGKDIVPSAKNSNYTNGVGSFDISGYTSISIYPIWELVDVYKVTINDSMRVINLPIETYVMKGESITFTQTGLKDVTITNKVSANEFTSGTFKTLISNNYVFAGFIDTAQSPAKTGYGTGSSDSDFTNYGILRVKTDSNPTVYTVEKGTKVDPSGVFTFTVTPDRNITLTAVWLMRGYSVTYQYAGGSPEGSDLTEQSKNYSKKIEYSYLLEGMPIKVGQGFNYADISGTAFDTNGSKSYTAGFDSNGNAIMRAFKITDGLELKGYYKTTTSTTNFSYESARLQLPSKLTSSGTSYIIYFKLKHSGTEAQHYSLNTKGSMYSDTEYRIESFCNPLTDSSHFYGVYLDWYCYYCDFTTDYFDLESNSSIGYYEFVNENNYQSVSDTQCRSEIKCSNCKQVVDYDYKLHEPYLTSDADFDSDLGQVEKVNPATCTKDLVAKDKCKYCDSVFGDSRSIENTALGHNWLITYAWKDESMGCEGGVNITNKCKRCSTIQQNTEKFSHSWGNQQTDNSKKQCESGYYYQKCTNTYGMLTCGAKKPGSRGPHKFNKFEFLHLKDAEGYAFDVITCTDYSWYCVPLCGYCGYAKTTTGSDTVMKWKKSDGDKENLFKLKITMYRESYLDTYGNFSSVDQNLVFGVRNISYEINATRGGSTLHDQKIDWFGDWIQCSICKQNGSIPSSGTFTVMPGGFYYMYVTDETDRLISRINYADDIVYSLYGSLGASLPGSYYTPPDFVSSYWDTDHGSYNFIYYDADGHGVESKIERFSWGYGDQYDYGVVQVTKDLSGYYGIDGDALEKALNAQFEGELTYIKTFDAEDEAMILKNF